MHNHQFNKKLSQICLEGIIDYLKLLPPEILQLIASDSKRVDKSSRHSKLGFQQDWESVFRPFI